MNTRHAKLTPAVVALLVGIVGSLVWASASADPARPVTNLVVPIAGTIGAGAENIALKGQARIMSTFVTDPELGGPPSVVLAIDLLNVLGVGQSSGAKYLARGRDHTTRLFRPTDLVEIVFPVFRVGPKGNDVDRPVLASFFLTFDEDGQLEAARATLSSSPFQANQ